MTDNSHKLYQYSREYIEDLERKVEELRIQNDYLLKTLTKVHERGLPTTVISLKEDDILIQKGDA